MCDLRKVLLRDAFGKAFYLKVAGMDLHQQCSFRADRGVEICFMSPVCCANFHQLASCACHDVRHAEGPTDLDQFTSRNRHLFALRQAVERQQHGCCIVVNNKRAFCPG